MSSVSVVPAVMAQLKTNLVARAGLSGIQITDGLPTTPEMELIAILDAHPHAQHVIAMRGSVQPREEEFTLTVLVSVVRAGDLDHAAVTARAYALAQEVENEILEDPTITASLGSNGFASVTGLPVRKNGPDSDIRREAKIEVEITCMALNEGIG